MTHVFNEVFLLWWYEFKWFLVLCELWELFSLQFLNKFFPRSCSVPILMELHHTHRQDSKGLLYWLLELFLCITPSSLINSSHHGIPKLWSVSHTTQQYHRALFGFTLPATWSGNCLWAESQSNHRVHFFCFPSRNHSALLPAVQYVKTVVSSILSSFLVVYRGEAIPDPVIISQWEAEYFLIIFYCMSNTIYKVTVETVVNIISHRGLAFPPLGRKDWAGLGLEHSFSQTPHLSLFSNVSRIKL